MVDLSDGKCNHWVGQTLAIAWSRRSREARTGVLLSPVPKCEGPGAPSSHSLPPTPILKISGLLSSGYWIGVAVTEASKGVICNIKKTKHLQHGAGQALAGGSHSPHAFPRSPRARDRGRRQCRRCGRSFSSDIRPVRTAHPPPLPPGYVLGKFSVFNGLAAVICRKHLVLRYLECKYLKTRCLSGVLCDARGERDNAGLRSTHDSQLQIS
jgi:hypothetical protein